MSRRRWSERRKDRLLNCGVRFFMAAALTGNQTAGGYAPFALGCVAAAGPGAEGFSALLGAAAGAAVFMNFAEALPFLAAAVLILAWAAAFRGSARMSRPQAVSAAAAALFLAVSLICVAESLDPAGGILPCLTAAVLTGAATWYLHPLLHPRRDRDAWAGAMFLAAALLLAVQEVTIAGLSLGRTLLCTLLAWTAWGRGAASGAAAGLGAGLTADLCAGGGNGLLTAAFGLGGLLCGRYHGGKRRRAAALFLLGTLAAALTAGGVFYGADGSIVSGGGVSGGESGIVSGGNLSGVSGGNVSGADGDLSGGNVSGADGDLSGGNVSGAGGDLSGGNVYGADGLITENRPSDSPLSGGVPDASGGAKTVSALLNVFSLSGGLTLLAECALGMILFLTLPKRLSVPEPETPAVQTGQPWTNRLERAASALRELYDACAPEEEPEEGPSEVFDRAAERVCRSCPLCSVCWENSYASTFQSLNDAIPRLMDRGRLLPADLPPRFTDRCVRLGEFLSAVNTELSAYLLRRQYRRRLAEARTGARRQYAQLSELLSSAASGIRATAVPAFGEERCRLGLELRPRHGESVCGDAADSFRTEDGLWCLVLADGMGSGEEARRESSLTCRLLRQFLEAGVHPEAAFRTLNAAMSLRGEETGSFPTLDVCTFDPAAGEAAFYKYGAAPSYLKKGGVVRRVSGSSLPMGLQAAPPGPDVTRTRLEPGSFIVLVSDGVADPVRDEWLQDLLAGWEGDDPQVLAETVLEESAKRRNLSDDCAALVLFRPVSGPRRA